MARIEEAAARRGGLARARVAHDDDVEAGIRQSEGGGQPGDTGTDDGDVRCGVTHDGRGLECMAPRILPTPKLSDGRRRIFRQNFPEEDEMLKTIFTIGVVALLGLFALKLIGVLFFPLIGLAVKILLLGAVVYGVMLVVAPDTARRLRDKVNSPRSY